MNSIRIRFGIFLKDRARWFSSLSDYILWMVFDLSKFRKIERESSKKVLVVLINQNAGNVGGNFCSL
jgi:hypothetical protein